MIRPQRTHSKSGSAETHQATHPLERLAVAGTSALVVLSTLVPSEDAVRGSGALLAAAWIFMLLVVQWITWKGIIRLQLKLPDWIVLALAAWMAISSSAMAWQGNPRQTLNALWQWEALFAGYWTIRQLFTTALRIRWLVAVMISIIVGLSAHGLYQFFVGIPHFISQYQTADEDERRDILIESGVDPDPHSPVVRNFEDRLRSKEVYATFVLANSLAGVVAPWLIVLLAWQLQRSNCSRFPLKIALGFFSLIALFCLVLTKSRSAWIAFAAGTLGLAVVYGRSVLRGRALLGTIGAAAAAILAIGAIGFFSGALDKQIFTEAWLSVSYRLQYWQAAIQMALTQPVFGCGPGNFQEYYALYKLPIASETIADPHNFLLEVAATAGLPAAVLLLAVILMSFKSLVHEDSGITANDKVERGAASNIFVGALIGGLLAIPYGWLIDFPPETDPWFGLPILLSIELPVAALMLAILYRGSFEVSSPRLWRAPLGIAIMVVLINLLAAGGISYLAVGQSLWLLLALALNATAKSRFIENRYVPSIALAFSGALLIACIVTNYYPVLQSSILLEGARQQFAEARGIEDLDRARQTATLAANADRWSAEPWRILAQIDMQRAMLRDASALDDFEEDVAHARRRNRHSQALEVSIGIQYLAAYQRGGFRAGLQQSIAAFSRAAELQPNSNYIHAQLAWVAHLADESQLAARHARKALELDAANPHWEQKLKQRRIEDFAPDDSAQLDQPSPSRVDAEHIAVWLRNHYDSGGAESSRTR